MKHCRAILGFSVSIIMLFAATGMSFAQVVSQVAENQIEEIFVTSTRIGSWNFESNSAIVTVSLEKVERGSDVSLEMMLQQQPQFSPDMNAATPLFSEGGRAQLNLRVLGQTET